MKILLIMPEYLKGKTKIKDRIHSGLLPPIGLLYIASALRDNHEITILDLRTKNWDDHDFSSYIKKFNPDVVGIYSTSWTFFPVMNVARLVKENCSAKVVVGGPQVGSYPVETLTHNCFDFGVIGEGEYIIQELMNALEKNKNFNDVKGIIYRDKKSIKLNPGEKIISNIDKLPFPSYDLLEIKAYYSALSLQKKMTSMITSRGCPFKCAFCSKPWGRNILRLRNLDNVLDEIELLNSMGIHEIVFSDDTFTVNRKRTLQFCRLIKKRRLDLVWSINTRVDTVDNELLKEMKKQGLVRITYGIDSGDSRILRLMNKRYTLNQATKAVKITLKNNIEVVANFIIGYPGETIDTIKKTVDYSIQLKPNFAMYSPFFPLPNSPIYDQMISEGKIYDIWREQSLGKKIRFEDINIDGLSILGKCNFVKNAYRKFYLRLRILKNVPLFFESSIRFTNSIKNIISTFFNMF